jgi:hypothetical protein
VTQAGSELAVNYPAATAVSRTLKLLSGRSLLFGDTNLVVALICNLPQARVAFKLYTALPALYVADSIVAFFNNPSAIKYISDSEYLYAFKLAVVVLCNMKILSFKNIFGGAARVV